MTTHPLIGSPDLLKVFVKGTVTSVLEQLERGLDLRYLCCDMVLDKCS